LDEYRSVPAKQRVRPVTAVRTTVKAINLFMDSPFKQLATEVSITFLRPRILSVKNDMAGILIGSFPILESLAT
jgi:hypothetical protein